MPLFLADRDPFFLPQLFLSWPQDGAQDGTQGESVCRPHIICCQDLLWAVTEGQKEQCIDGHTGSKGHGVCVARRQTAAEGDLGHACPVISPCSVPSNTFIFYKVEESRGERTPFKSLLFTGEGFFIDNNGIVMVPTFHKTKGPKKTTLLNKQDTNYKCLIIASKPSLLLTLPM